jgi:hypothetical protein
MQGYEFAVSRDDSRPMKSGSVKPAPIKSFRQKGALSASRLLTTCTPTLPPPRSTTREDEGRLRRKAACTQPPTANK